jgi:hypothetical protein
VTPGVAARRELVAIVVMLLSLLRRMGSKSVLKSVGRALKRRSATLRLSSIESVADTGDPDGNEERICLMEISFI